MAEEVLFETESRQTGADVAAYLRTVAEKLELGERIQLSAGEDSVTVDPPADVEFEVKVEREGTEKSLELELEWDESGGDRDTGGSLQVE